MKLHYFNQSEPDSDDRALFQARAEGLVPPKCLLGGALISIKLMPASTNAGLAPCKSCHGPRERCGGEPLLSSLEEERSEERRHLLKMFTGDDPSDPLAKLLKGR